MNLISMTDFVLELEKGYFDSENTLSGMMFKTFKYANFLKQPPKLGMLIPCDENDVPLEEPENYDLWCKYGDFTQFGTSLTLKCKPYHEAKERVFFDGFEICDRQGSHKCIVLKQELIFDDEHFLIDWLKEITIEDLVKYNLKLTDSAIKQLNL